MNIKYCGPALDYSGYAEANRNDIASIMTAGIGVTIELTKHCLEIADFGLLGKKIQSAVDSQIPYDIKIIHTTPNIFNRYLEPGKYHIGRVIWETDKLPPDFAVGAQMMDEIWTASEYNKQAIINAGVTKPIYVIPEAIDINPPAINPSKTNYDDYFKFYSIFEWTERKNPVALLKAFWEEFKQDEKVCLVLKTYLDNFTQERRNDVKHYIRNIKKQILEGKEGPPVFVCNFLMSRNQIYRFHNAHDCLVSTHRGEGWGVPQMEAMLLSKPIISTNCGGIHEYLKDKEDAFLIDHKLIPIVENSRNQQWYRQDQNWADVDINKLKAAMRYVYENQGRAGEIGEAAQKTIKASFSHEVVGKKMQKRLKVIVDTKLRKHDNSVRTETINA
jgi:glycosyltransferase involved in cell wall biosynthesis